MALPSQPQTSLSEAARHVVVPKGAVTTAYPAVRETCQRLGLGHDRWQAEAARLMLGKNKAGLFAADAIAASIPRQVGKTYLIGSIVFALCLINPGTTVLWTAHRTPTATETFESMRAMCQQPKIAPHIVSATAPAGNGVIRFRNGSRILFGAREQGFGRGFTKVAVVVFDEAQILTQNAIDDMIPATNAAANPLIFYIGTPPKPSDRGDVFINLRHEALSGDSDDVLYIEFSADEDADPADREQWAKANPSFPSRTNVRAMQRMLKNLGRESFLREALGIWDKVGTSGVFPPGAWGRLASDEPPGEPLAVGIAANVSQTFLSLGAVLGGEPRHVGSVLRFRAGVQTEAFISEVRRIQDTYDVPVGIDKRGPAAALIPSLEAAGIQLTQLATEDFIQASADMRRLVDEGAIRHGNYDDLNAAVDAATWRQIGERRAFGRKTGDIDALEAVAIALWADENDGEYDLSASIF